MVPFSFSSTAPVQSSGQILSLRSMHMVANFSHHNDRTVPTFVVSTPHEAGQYFAETIVLGCIRGLPQAMDGIPPGAVITNGAGGPRSIVTTSTA